jgi:hypothetical protein
MKTKVLSIAQAVHASPLGDKVLESIKALLVPLMDKLEERLADQPFAPFSMVTFGTTLRRLSPASPVDSDYIQSVFVGCSGSLS